MILDTDGPLAVAVGAAIRAGDLPVLTRLLGEHPGLATARVGDPDRGMSHTLLHVVTDWPGHYPNGPAVVAALVAAGADVNARFTGPHTEAPLHWAASNDDVPVLDALLAAGADLDAPARAPPGPPPPQQRHRTGRLAAEPWRAQRPPARPHQHRGQLTAPRSQREGVLLLTPTRTACQRLLSSGTAAGPETQRSRATRGF